MTNALKKDTGFTRSEIDAMAHGNKDLPVGVYRMSQRKSGYRIIHTIRGVDYRFGSFQSLEHALRVNKKISEFVGVHRDLLDKTESKISLDDVQNAVDEIVESKLILQEMTFRQELDELKDVIKQQNKLIVNQSTLLEERLLDLSSERKGLLGRVFG